MGEATSTPHLRGANEIDRLETIGPLPEATGTEMTARGETFWAAGERVAGTWECEAGPSYWSFEKNEFIHVLRGSMTVKPDGGEPVTLGPGDTAVFPEGWNGTWEIHEPIRKVYCIF